jgi:hypothetical protein
MSSYSHELFLSKADRDYLLNVDQAGHEYVCVKSRLNKKLKVFVDQDLPLLLERGYLSDIAEFRHTADFRNASNSLVAQLAEQGLASFGERNNHENMSPRWDLNPRPQQCQDLLKQESSILLSLFIIGMFSLSVLK